MRDIDCDREIYIYIYISEYAFIYRKKRESEGERQREDNYRKSDINCDRYIGNLVVPEHKEKFEGIEKETDWQK